MSEPDSSMLRSFLAGRDVLCPSCDYNLRDLSGEVCPECGERLVLAVRPVSARLKLWLGAVIGASVGAGFCGLLMSWLVVDWLRYESMVSLSEWWPLPVGLLVQGPFLAVLLCKGGGIRRLSAGVRWIILIAAWGISLLTAAAFFNIFA